MTAYAEVIGDPIAQSKSPVIHGFWLRQLGIAAEYRATQVKSEELVEYFKARKADPNWRGCNITMPHKQTVLPLLNQVDDIAARIGAVNTVYRDGKGLVGTNTDAAGFLEPIAPILAQTHYFRMARVLGAGGAARAIVAALADEGFTLVVAARDAAKAAAVLDDLDPGGAHHAAPLAHFAMPTEFVFDDREGCCDLIVNATPLGMPGNDTLAFQWSHAPPGSIAYDIVTDPVNTLFLTNADAAGFRTIDGLNMLIAQAAHAFGHFFGTEAPREYDAQLREILSR